MHVVVDNVLWFLIYTIHAGIPVSNAMRMRMCKTMERRNMKSSGRCRFTPEHREHKCAQIMWRTSIARVVCHAEVNDGILRRKVSVYKALFWANSNTSLPGNKLPSEIQ